MVSALPISGVAKCRFLEETGRVVGNVKRKASDKLNSWRRHDEGQSKGETRDGDNSDA